MYIIEVKKNINTNDFILYIVNTIFNENFSTIENALSHSNFSYTTHSKKNKTGKIGINDLLELKKFLYLKNSSQKKLAIIDHADFLTNEAQNSILKVTEDDISDTIILLIVKDKRRLLSTILSRGISLKINEIGIIHESLNKETKDDIWYNSVDKFKHIQDFLKLSFYDQLLYAKDLTSKNKVTEKDKLEQQKENKVESFLTDLLLYEETILLKKGSADIEKIRLIEDCLVKVKKNVNARAIFEYIILTMNNGR